MAITWTDRAKAAVLPSCFSGDPTRGLETLGEVALFRAMPKPSPDRRDVGISYVTVGGEHIELLVVQDQETGNFVLDLFDGQ